MSTPATVPSNPDGVTGKLCQWIHATRFEDIPEEHIERAKYLILDGIACALVASHLPWSENAANGIFKMESGGQCSVIGWEGKKLSPLSAALLNSTFTQGFELDDYHSKAPLHSNSLLLPALFAAIESTANSAENGQDKSTSGEDFLKAYILGCEIGPRVGLALHGGDLLSRGWHSGAVQGPSASAAAVSSLLELNPIQIEWALGIACTQAGGLMSAQFGSMAKRMQHGFASRNGLFAALMARENYTGIEQVYETPYGGFLSCFSQGATFEPKSKPDEIVSELGTRWEIEGIRVKLHAAMAALHGTIDCVENLQKAHPDKLAVKNLENIESIVTRHGKAAYEHGGWIAPPDKPLSTVSAQMSIQYAAAAQLVDGQVLMQQYGASRLNRPVVRDVMNKVQPEHDPSIDKDGGDAGLFETVMTIKFTDGTELQESVRAPKGILPPASNEDIVEKWRMLVKDVVDDERRDRIEKTVLDLDKSKDVRQLIKLLAGDAKCPIDV